MKRGRNQRRRPGVNPNRALDSNGPEVRIRGTANQIYDKYSALARDASSSGDRVKAESYLQHAEHYFRLIRASQQNQQGQQSQQSSGDGDGDQPAIENGKDNGSRDRNHDRRPRRDQDDNRGGDNQSAEASGDETASRDDDDNGAEEEKPKRRRARRPTKRAAKDEGESAEQKDEESAPAA